MKVTVNEISEDKMVTHSTDSLEDVNKLIREGCTLVSIMTHLGHMEFILKKDFAKCEKPFRKLMKLKRTGEIAIALNIYAIGTKFSDDSFPIEIINLSTCVKCIIHQNNLEDFHGSITLEND